MVAGRIVGLVAEVVGQLLLQRRLEHPLRQPGQHPLRPDQLGTLAACPGHQTTGDLILLCFGQPHGRHTVLRH